MIGQPVVIGLGAAVELVPGLNGLIALDSVDHQLGEQDFEQPRADAHSVL